MQVCRLSALLVLMKERIFRLVQFQCNTGKQETRQFILLACQNFPLMFRIEWEFGFRLVHFSGIFGQPDNFGRSLGNDRQNRENQNSVMEVVYVNLFYICRSMRTVFCLSFMKYLLNYRQHGRKESFSRMRNRFQEKTDSNVYMFAHKQKCLYQKIVSHSSFIFSSHSI